MSIGGFSLLSDGYNKGLHDRIAENIETDRTTGAQLGNLYGIATFPDKVQQTWNDTDMSTLGLEQAKDMYTLNQLAYPGQMAHYFMMGQAMPWLTYGNIQNQLAQQAMIQQMMYRNPLSFLAMMKGANLPTGAN